MVKDEIGPERLNSAPLFIEEAPHERPDMLQELEACAEARATRDGCPAFRGVEQRQELPGERHEGDALARTKESNCSGAASCTSWPRRVSSPAKAR
jgi:hypothetical protein